MADIYLDSVAGNDSNSGASWALAKATLAGTASVAAAGDTVYTSHVHDETPASVTATFAGTPSNPVRILCVDTGTGALATTGKVTTTTSGSISFGGSFYCYGITFKAGSGANVSNINLANATNNSVQTFDNCKFVLGSSSNSSQINLIGTGAYGCKTRLINCQYKFGASGQGLKGSTILSECLIQGGSISSGTTSVSTLFTPSATRIQADGLDMTNLSTTFNVAAASASYGGFLIIRNAKFPASWAGGLITGTRYPPTYFSMRNCDSADTNYRHWHSTYNGDVKHSTSVYRNSGFSDGTTSLSWTLATTADNKFPNSMLRSPEIEWWQDSTGSSVTATVEILHDGASAFTDQDVWLEIQYLGDSSYPLSSFANDSSATVIATATAQSSSSATWTGASGTGPNSSSTWNTLKLSASFTPQCKGPHVAMVCMAIPSKTIYVDPVATVA